MYPYDYLTEAYVGWATEFYEVRAARIATRPAVYDQAVADIAAAAAAIGYVSPTLGTQTFSIDEWSKWLTVISEIYALPESGPVQATLLAIRQRLFDAFELSSIQTRRFDMRWWGKERVRLGLALPLRAITVDPATDTFTLAAHSFPVNHELRFRTTEGALPGPLLGNSYFVIAEGLTANAFKVSASAGGAAVNITSSGGTFGVDLSPPLA